MTEFKSQQPAAVESTKVSLPNYHVVGASVTYKELITGIARISADALINDVVLNARTMPHYVH